MKIDLTKIGDATGLILPEELLAHLRLEHGDSVHVTELPDGSLKVARYDPADAEAMEIAQELFDEYRETFERLAE